MAMRSSRLSMRRSSSGVSICVVIAPRSSRRRAPPPVGFDQLRLGPGVPLWREGSGRAAPALGLEPTAARRREPASRASRRAIGGGMRLMLARLAALLALLLVPAPAFAWWDYGHQTVARIAWTEVSPRARAEMRRLMAEARLLETPECPAGNIAELSVCPDCIKRYRDRFSSAYSWHFVDVDICRPFDLRAPCANHDCVTDQIGRAARMLRDRAVPARERLMALAFLV